MKIRTILLLTLATGAEAALLSLANWQYHRMLEKESLAAHEATRSTITLTGTWDTAATVALDNQPNPQNEDQIGWRLLTPLQTSGSTVIVDRGWLPLPQNRTAEPNFTPFIPITQSVTGVVAEYPHRHGWLKGPDTTTNLHILAWLNPTRITSATLAETYLQATTITSSNTLLIGQPPASPAGINHASYALQWLVMAAIFPIMVFWRWRG